MKSRPRAPAPNAQRTIAPEPAHSFGIPSECNGLDFMGWKVFGISAARDTVNCRRNFLLARLVCASGVVDPKAAGSLGVISGVYLCGERRK